MFVRNFKILSPIIPQKSLTETNFYNRDRQTNTQTYTQILFRKRQNYISPIYFVCFGYKYVGRKVQQSHHVQKRSRPVWTSMQSDQNPCYSHLLTLYLAELKYQVHWNLFIRLLIIRWFEM